MVRIYLLGRIEVWEGEAARPLPTRHARRLLALLVMRPKHGYTRRELANALWPGVPESAALQSLRKALQHVRHGLGSCADRLQAEKDRLRLELHDLWVDALFLESAPDAEVPDLYLGMLGGSDVPDLAEEELDALWDNAWAVQLEERFQSAHVALARDALAAGDHSSAEQWFEKALSSGSSDEEPYLAYMRLLDEGGRPEEAVRVYRRLVAVLSARRLPVSTEASEAAKHIRRRIRRVHRAMDSGPGVQPAWLSFQALHASQNPLIGRELDLEAVRDKLSIARVVTLTGAGGIGKTRLAQEVASEIGHERAHGAVWIDLTTIEASDQVVQAVAEGAHLGLPLDFDVLAATDMLLVLDNCEHVLEGARAFVQEAIRRCPRVTILATSREALALPIEYRLELDPLDRETALQLFRGRVEQWGGRDAHTAEEIYEQTGGLPLAVELLAAQSSGINESALQRQMPERHRSLEAIIEESLAQCNEEERRLLGQLSLIPGPFEIEAVGALLADESSAPMVKAAERLMDKLVGRSLIIRTGHTYRILPTIRETAQELLTPSDQVASGLSIARYAREMAKGHLALSAARQAELPGETAGRIALYRFAFGVFLENEPNEAFALATDLGLGMARLGRAAEGLSMLESAGISAKPADDIEHAMSSLSMGNLCKELGQSRRALECYAIAEPLFRANNRYRGVGACGVNASFVHTDLGEYDEAKAALVRASAAFEIYAKDAPAEDIAFARLNVFKSAARIALHECNPEEGRRIGCEGLALAREIGDMHSAAVILTNLGDTELLDGEGAAAELWLRESLAIATELGDSAAIAFSNSGLGLALISQGRYTEAKTSLSQALSAFAAADQRRDLLMTIAMSASLGTDGEFLRLFAACHYHRVRLGYAFSPAMKFILGPLLEAAAERVGPTLAPRYARLGEGSPIRRLTEEAFCIIERRTS